MLSQIYIGLHVKYFLFFSDFNENYIFEKLSNIKFQGKPSSGRRILLCGYTESWTERGRNRNDKADSQFRNFVKAPKNLKKSTKTCCHCRIK